MAPRNTTAESLTRKALTPGRFGNDAILAAIGRGGMGEMFRAHDSTLGRDVALKVLPVR